MRLKTTAALALALLLTAACGQLAGVRSQLAPQGAVRAQAVVKPPMQDMLSPNFNERGGAKITAIVLHHTAMAADAVDTGKFFQNPAAKVSAHYVVGRDGLIIRCVPDEKRAWHAGRSEFQGQPDVNTFSIGIEICNVGDNVEPYPEAQMQAVLALTAWLAKTHGVPTTRLTRHRDVALPAGRKPDTSNNFDHLYAYKAVQALLDSRKPPAYTFRPAPGGYDPRKQSYVVQPGDTWASIGEHIYDAESMGTAIATLNPGVTLAPGTVVKLPVSYDHAF
jgi:N-acetyl-anhydromuramyl-L-alanine amidase AmpD